MLPRHNRPDVSWSRRVSFSGWAALRHVLSQPTDGAKLGCRVRNGYYSENILLKNMPKLPDGRSLYPILGLLPDLTPNKSEMRFCKIISHVTFAIRCPTNRKMYLVHSGHMSPHSHYARSSGYHSKTYPKGEPLRAEFQPHGSVACFREGCCSTGDPAKLVCRMCYIPPCVK